MLQNARVVAFTVSELLKENQQGGKINLPPTQIRVKGLRKTFWRTTTKKSENENLS